MLFGYNQVDGRGRPTEDRIVIKKLLEHCDCFAVFDGHGGSAVVRATAELFPKRIQLALEAAGGNAILSQPARIGQILQQCFLEHDKELARNITKLRDSGSTGTVALITPTHVIMAYCGDSPAFLMNPLSGQILHEIGKHEPTLAAESERIQAAGGFVEIDEYGTPRVDGNLMVSRAFGDFSLKFPENAVPPFESDWSRLKVTAAADIMIWERPAGLGVLAIMSDGMVETNTNILKPLVAVARDIQLALKGVGYNLSTAATALTQQHVMNSVGSSRQSYTGDDLSLILVDVGLKDTKAAVTAAAAAAAAGGGATAAGAAASAAAAATAVTPLQPRAKTRKARHHRRNRTGKKSRIATIFCIKG